jgi:excisionase family DNA binding protein
MKEKKRAHLSTFVTTGQAARHCQVSVPAFRSWIEQGQLNSFKTPGGHFRIALDEFERFLRAYRMPPYRVLPPETRILIVDDDPQVVELFMSALAEDPRGFKLEAATGGYEALIKVGAFRPSLLLLDVLMPQVDGLEVCRRLKASAETRAIRILGITGHVGNISALLEAGADACLAKPVDLQRMRQEVDRLLAPREV